MSTLWSKAKAAAHRFAVWVYNWITVLVGVVTGALAFIPDFINQSLVFVDVVGLNNMFEPFSISPSTAAKITSVVALAKGVMAWYQSRRV